MCFFEGIIRLLFFLRIINEDTEIDFDFDEDVDDEFDPNIHGYIYNIDNRSGNRGTSGK